MRESIAVEVAVTPNTPPELTETLVQTISGSGRTVSVGRYEQRSLDYGDLISVMILWKVASVIGDELLREAVRASVETIRAARHGHRTQGMIELPGPEPVQYWLGENVPDHALDAIEADAVNATPGESRYWDRDGERWVTMDQLRDR